MVGTLGAKNLGDPTVVRTWSKDDTRLLPLGAIMGKVRGLSLRSNIYADEPSVAFVGVFEGIKAADGERVRSSACFLPRTLNSVLAAQVLEGHKLPTQAAPKRGQKIDVLGLNEIVFAVEISVKKADSEVGFEYVTKLHGHDGFLISDPLADLRQFIPGAKLDVAAISHMGEGASIAPPAERPAALAAPAKEKAPARKKK